jgi:hypothetical protein
LSETFLILRRIARDMIQTVRCSSCNVPLVLSDFNGSYNFSTDCMIYPQMSNFMKIRPVLTDLLHGDRQTLTLTWHRTLNGTQSVLPIHNPPSTLTSLLQHGTPSYCQNTQQHTRVFYPFAQCSPRSPLLCSTSHICTVKMQICVAL